ncbi:zinc-binding dehydrogenase [Aquimarina intermedia]
MKRQHEILNRIADLLDGGTLRPTLNKTMQDLTVENLKEAHALQESGKAIGKTVIEF